MNDTISTPRPRRRWEFVVGLALVISVAWLVWRIESKAHEYELDVDLLQIKIDRIQDNVNAWSTRLDEAYEIMASKDLERRNQLQNLVDDIEQTEQ